MDGKRIRAARVARGLSLKDVGDAMGVSPQGVAYWEKTNPRFDYPKSEKLARVLSVEAGWLDGFGEIEGIPNPDERLKRITKIPLVDINAAFLFFVFGKYGRKVLDDLPAIEPTIEVSPGAFAVTVTPAQEFEGIERGNVVVIDVDIDPRENDVVIVFNIQSGRYDCHFSRYKDIREKITKIDNMFVARTMSYNYEKDEIAQFSGTVMLGVMVELRWVRWPRESGESSSDAC